MSKLVLGEDRMPDQVLREEMTIQSQTKFLLTVREFVSRLARQTGMSDADHNRVILAVDEAVANVIQHGYLSKPDGVIQIVVDADGKNFRITIRDTGITYDPRTSAEVNMQQHVLAAKRRGLGVHLIRKIMDEVVYNLVDGVQNELTLVKHLRPNP